MSSAALITGCGQTGPVTIATPVDHTAVLRALRAAAGRSEALLREAGDGRARVRKSDWTVGEVGSHLVYGVAVTISHQVMQPTVKRIITLMREMASVPVGGAPAGPPPQLGAIQALGKKAGATGAILHVALVAVLVLMVWKPGA